MDKQRFCAVWNKQCFEGSISIADDVFERLMEKYAETHRYYHTGAHINHCLKQMDKASDSLGYSDSVEMAVWFHDVVYELGDSENEKNSARWFQSWAEGQFSSSFIDQVSRLIVCTEHQRMPVDDAEKYVVDVDLSGLGADPSAFKRDGGNIRLEMAHLDDEKYIQSQNRFLNKLLDRPRIFFSSYFFEHYEFQARQNIMQQLEDNRLQENR